ncbi:hypothetical protein [Parabacteroides sp. FAFU027]|uniref:hypothetical protein n=1 Tax=Parabacteroides sp. FAFU027 TaxID=2922715 RepID=UPI001FAEE25D|nr:hypothetical protein [Parabacteroides sp. FAFU027]
MTDKYDIREDESLICRAESILFSFQKKIKVADLFNIEKFRITKNITLFHPTYEIEYESGSNLTIEGKSLLYDYFVLKIPEGIYEIHHQQGLKLAIFNKEEQIAEIRKNRIKVFKGDEYYINANSDVRKDLLIAICLVWDINDFKDSDNAVTIDLGNIGPVKRNADQNWTPIR